MCFNVRFEVEKLKRRYGGVPDVDESIAALRARVSAGDGTISSSGSRSRNSSSIGSGSNSSSRISGSSNSSGTRSFGVSNSSDDDEKCTPGDFEELVQFTSDIVEWNVDQYRRLTTLFLSFCQFRSSSPDSFSCFL